MTPRNNRIETCSVHVSFYDFTGSKLCETRHFHTIFLSDSETLATVTDSEFPVPASPGFADVGSGKVT